MAVSSSIAPLLLLLAVRCDAQCARVCHREDHCANRECTGCYYCCKGPACPPAPPPPPPQPPHSRIPRGREGSALALTPASPRSWWTTETAFWTRSFRLHAKTEALGSIQHKSRVDVDDGSTGGCRLEAFSRHRTTGCSETPNCAPRS